MHRSIFRSENSKVVVPFTLIVLFVYILLFEFVIPANSVIPKPTILLESISSLFIDYDFVSSFLLTFSSIYSVMLIAFLLFQFVFKYFIKFLIEFPGIGKLFSIGKYLIPLFFVFLFQLWFGNSIWGEYIFILVIIMGLLKTTAAEKFHSVNEEYLLAAKSLTASSKLIDSIYLKSLQPKLYNMLIEKHITIWSSVLVYEFICETDGIGNIFRLALKYNDLSLAITLMIILIIVLIIMEMFLVTIKKKYFYWN